MDTTRFINNKELLPILLSSGMNPDLIDSNGNTYLHSCRDLKTAKILVESGADITKHNNRQFGPLALLFQDLFSAKAYHNKLEQFDIKYPESGGCKNLLKYFIDNGANVNDFYCKRIFMEQFPLYHACLNDVDLDLVIFLIENGANLYDKKQGSALFETVRNEGSYKIMKYLIDHGANINYKNSMGRTALFQALIYDIYQTIYKLTNFGANVNIKDNWGITCLHIAAVRCKNIIIQRLIDSKADINAQCGEGNTPLHLAVRTFYYSDRQNAVKLLIDAKANLNIKNKKGQTPLHIATKQAIKIITYKIRYDIDDNSDNDGEIDFDSDSDIDDDEYRIEKIYRGEKSLTDKLKDSYNLKLGTIILLLKNRRSSGGPPSAKKDIKDNYGMTPYDYVLRECKEEDQKVYASIFGK